jgi:hypothetical protein
LKNAVKQAHGIPEEVRLKTVSADQEIDLHRCIAALSREFVPGYEGGFLFTTISGKTVGFLQHHSPAPSSRT